jgi:hypothetical protein
MQRPSVLSSIIFLLFVEGCSNGQGASRYKANKVVTD